MSAALDTILELILGVASTPMKGNKRADVDFKKAGINKTVFFVCTAIWLCVVFVLSIIFQH